MNSIDPVILFFLFGLVAGLLRSELKLPSALYDSLSIFLLLAIGLKGGQGLATQPLGPLLPQLLAVVVLGVVQTLIAFGALRAIFRFDRPNAAATAAHYGSVSVARFDDIRSAAIVYCVRSLVPIEKKSTSLRNACGMIATAGTSTMIPGVRSRSRHFCANS